MERIAWLTPGAVIVHVGGESEQDVEHRKATAERALRAVREALRDGVVPGGGIALLACRPRLRRELATRREAAERAAYSLLIDVCGVPTHQLLINAGRTAGSARRAVEDDPSLIDLLPRHRTADPLGVVRTAVERAVRTAALSLTTAVVVHGRTDARGPRR
jgi:chaperonin GroEL